MMYRLFNIIAAISIGDPNVPKVGASDSNVVQFVLQLISGIAAAVAILIISIGAFKLITSRGNPESLSRARDTIIYAIVGFVISAAAFLIVTFVVEQI